jgi:hypothetical protein
MDDFNVSSLHESKNEWGSRLLTILTPIVIEGLKSIFDEAFKLCKDNGETEKYLMTFQNFISRIPKWNPNIIEIEKNRIIERSGCGYLEDLVTCVHIIQLKLLTAIRVGQKQKKIDINIPKLDDFIHKVYVNVARKIYKNVYLFETGIPPLQVQKHHRELETIVQECILNTIRESIPVESILRAYMDETIEEDVVEEIKEQVIGVEKENKSESENAASDNSYIVGEGNASEPSTESPIQSDVSKLSFNNIDYVRDGDNNEHHIEAPKDIERLEEISNIRNAQRKLETDEEDDESVKLKIFHDNDIQLDNLDIHVINEPELSLIPDLLLDDIEVLA